MSEPDNDGCAFPSPPVYGPNGEGIMEGDPGMSLRDYFAAKVMHAELLSAGSFHGPALALAKGASEAGHTIMQHIAFLSYGMADAMLEARKR